MEDPGLPFQRCLDSLGARRILNNTDDLNEIYITFSLHEAHGIGSILVTCVWDMECGDSISKASLIYNYDD